MKRMISVLLAVVMLFSLSSVAFADGTGEATKGYLVLGADLSKEQTATVLELLQVSDTSDYTVSYTTNAEEHQAFDSYLASNVIGTRAISSILMVPAKKGSGISISSYNITYCTVAMYQNALISAGVEDVAVYIAAPFGVSGTCALVSAMNAYSTLSGEVIDEKTADTAVDEIVTMGKMGDAIGSNDKAAELMAVLKQQMIEQDLNRDQIRAAIDLACKKMDITLEDDIKQQIEDVLMKIKDTDIDVNALAKQAGSLYNKVRGTMQELGIGKEEAIGFLRKLLAWASKLLNK